ncbi:hypothetical protein AA0120_g2704 [Alternaria tenuissima]|nr:hypothetical protein AA0120_g2704 [Alternaria tenuissima]
MYASLKLLCLSVFLCTILLAECAIQATRLDGGNALPNAARIGRAQVLPPPITPNTRTELWQRAEKGRCAEGEPCAGGECCNGKTGWCGSGSDFCGKDVCISNCDHKSECGAGAAVPGTTCPLKVCCSGSGYCGVKADYCDDTCQSNCEQPGSSEPNRGDIRKLVIGVEFDDKKLLQTNDR